MTYFTKAASLFFSWFWVFRRVLQLRRHGVIMSGWSTLLNQDYLSRIALNQVTAIQEERTTTTTPRAPTLSLGTPVGVINSGEWGSTGGQSTSSHHSELQAQKSRIAIPKEWKILNLFYYCLHRINHLFVRNLFTPAFISIIFDFHILLIRNLGLCFLCWVRMENI